MSVNSESIGVFPRLIQNLYLGKFIREPFQAEVALPRIALANHTEYCLHAFVDLPVQVVRKSLPTLLESVLKIGGFLAFIKLLSSLLDYSNKLLFVKALKKDFEQAKSPPHDINKIFISTEEAPLIPTPLKVEALFSFETVA